jgi:hypothetical protein
MKSSGIHYRENPDGRAYTDMKSGKRHGIGQRKRGAYHGTDLNRREQERDIFRGQKKSAGIIPRDKSNGFAASAG